MFPSNQQKCLMVDQWKRQFDSWCYIFSISGMSICSSLLPQHCFTHQDATQAGHSGSDSRQVVAEKDPIKLIDQ
jgi:hypothetical protein